MARVAQAQRHGGPMLEVAPIATADYPVPAKRPQHSQLSHAALTRDFGIAPRRWETALADIIDELHRK